jgi:hypothetical protein
VRDAIALFEQELTRRDGRSTTPESSRFVGMMERDLESIYNLLLATPENTDSEFNSEGSCHPLRECNMLHLLEDGVAPAKDVEDNAYPILCTPGEQAESMTKSTWNKPWHEKLIRPTRTVMMDALAYNTSTLRACKHEHTVCVIRSSRARGRHPSSLELARTLLRPPWGWPLNPRPMRESVSIRSCETC